MDDSNPPKTFAEEQLERARNDPRLQRKHGAHVADYWAFLEEAELQRSVYILGAHALHKAAPAAEPPVDQHHAKAIWERAELARAAINSDFAHMNGLTLIGMYSNLDGFVEGFLPSLQQFLAEAITRDIIDKALADHPEEAAAVAATNPDFEDALREVATGMILQRFPDYETGGKGASRWEKPLAEIGRGAPADRRIPHDMNEALQQIGALRNVIVHRGGRLDARTIKSCPSLATKFGYEDGDLVRITCEQYRRFSAALRTYGDEVVLRVAGLEYPYRIEDWHQRYMLGN